MPIHSANHRLCSTGFLVLLIRLAYTVVLLCSVGLVGSAIAWAIQASGPPRLWVEAGPQPPGALQHRPNEYIEYSNERLFSRCELSMQTTAMKQHFVSVRDETLLPMNARRTDWRHLSEKYSLSGEPIHFVRLESFGFPTPWIHFISVCPDILTPSTIYGRTRVDWTLALFCTMLSGLPIFAVLRVGKFARICSRYIATKCTYCGQSRRHAPSKRCSECGREDLGVRGICLSIVSLPNLPCSRV
jgi:hypothetical protein